MILAEDTREVYDRAKQALSEGKVAVVVTTPKFTRNGCSQGCIPVEANLVIRCVEIPPIAREDSLTIRALDAAGIIAHELEDEYIQFEDIEQTLSNDGTVTASTTFSTTIYL